MSKRLTLLLILGLCLVQGVVAHSGTHSGTMTINLIGDEVPLEHNTVNERVLKIANSNIYVKQLTKGYDAIGIEFEGKTYVAHIENDNIVTLGEEYDYDVDYTIHTTKEELLHIYGNRDSLSTLDALRILVFNKEVPMRVIWRLVGMFI